MMFMLHPRLNWTNETHTERSSRYIPYPVVHRIRQVNSKDKGTFQQVEIQLHNKQLKQLYSIQGEEQSAEDEKTKVLLWVR